MTDFSEDLQKQLSQYIQNKTEANKIMQEILKKIESSANYSLAYEYAAEYARVISESITELNIDEWLFGTACDVMLPSLEQLNTDINDLCVMIQTNKSRKAQIGLKAQREKFSELEAKNLIAKICDDIGMLEPEVTKHSVNCVDKVQKANMRLALKSGFPITVTRVHEFGGQHTQDGGKYEKNCIYCQSRSGTYKFKDVAETKGAEVFQRHPGCTCTIDYANEIYKTYTRIQ